MLQGVSKKQRYEIRSVGYPAPEERVFAWAPTLDMVERMAGHLYRLGATEVYYVDLLDNSAAVMCVTCKGSGKLHAIFRSYPCPMCEGSGAIDRNA